MQRERISENIYWFQSDIYAQVTAGVIAGTEWAIVIDTLAIPDETLEMRAFIEDDLKVPVRYIINTHHHADHTWGNCYFPGATILSHSFCREIMNDVEQKALESAQRQNSIYRNTKIVLPHLTFRQGKLTIKVGKRHLSLFPTPGNSPDGISILVEEDRILFSGDVFMPIPFFYEGNYRKLIESMRMIGELSLENIIQGHGDVILRGEIEEAINSNIQYLTTLEKGVREALRRKNVIDALEDIDIESCGKSKVLLGGLAEELHQRNIYAMYQMLSEEINQ